VEADGLAGRAALDAALRVEEAVRASLEAAGLEGGDAGAASLAAAPPVPAG